MIYVVYDDTGKIMKMGDSGEEALDTRPLESNESIMENIMAVTDMTHYVDITSSPHLITPKNDNTTTINKLTVDADGIDEIILSNQPSGSLVNIIGNPSASFTSDTDGIDEITFNVVGNYKIEVSKVDYTLVSFEIEAI